MTSVDIAYIQTKVVKFGHHRRRLEMSGPASADAAADELTSPFPSDWPLFTETQFDIELSVHTKRPTFFAWFVTC